MKVFTYMITAVALIVGVYQDRPANAEQFTASGTWVAGKRSGTWQASLSRDTNVIEGQISLTGGPVVSADVAGTLQGDEIDFGVVSNQREIASFSGVVSLDQLSGTLTMNGATGEWAGVWKAVHEAEAPIASSRSGALEAPFDKPSAAPGPAGDICDLIGNGAINTMSFGGQTALRARCSPRMSSLALLSPCPGQGGPPESNPPTPQNPTGILVNNVSRPLQAWPSITQSETSGVVAFPDATKQTVSYNDTQFFAAQSSNVGFGRRVSSTTWTQNPNQFVVPPPTGLTIFGDPSGASDKPGNFLLAYLAGSSSSSHGIGMSVSSDFGASYSTGPVVVNTPQNANLDKEWLAIDRTNNPAANTRYLCWTQFATNISPGTSQIWFSRKPVGSAFGAPVAVSKLRTAPDRVQGCQVAVAPDSSVYVVWWEEVDLGGQKTSAIIGQRSADGIHFPHPVFAVNASGNFDKPTDPTATTDCSGPLPFLYENPALKGHVRSSPSPSLAVNQQNGAVYIAFQRQRPGGTESQIAFVRSTNQGATWSTPPLAISDSTAGDKFMPAIAHSQTQGAIKVIWYDRRNDSNNISIDMYGAVSNDGGGSFGANTRITSALFGVPHLYPNFDCPVGACYMGDYISLANFDPSSAGFQHTWGDNSLKFHDPDNNLDVPDPDVRTFGGC